MSMFYCAAHERMEDSDTVGYVLAKGKEYCTASTLARPGAVTEALRELLKAGEHNGPCDNDEYGEEACSLHLAAYAARKEKAIAALAASVTPCDDCGQLLCVCLPAPVAPCERCAELIRERDEWVNRVEDLTRNPHPDAAARDAARLDFMQRWPGAVKNDVVGGSWTVCHRLGTEARSRSFFSDPFTNLRAAIDHAIEQYAPLDAAMRASDGGGGER